MNCAKMKENYLTATRKWFIQMKRMCAGRMAWYRKVAKWEKVPQPFFGGLRNPSSNMQTSSAHQHQLT